MVPSGTKGAICSCLSTPGHGNMSLNSGKWQTQLWMATFDRAYVEFVLFFYCKFKPILFFINLS